MNWHWIFFDFCHETFFDHIMFCCAQNFQLRIKCCDKFYVWKKSQCCINAKCLLFNALCIRKHRNLCFFFNFQIMIIIQNTIQKNIQKNVIFNYEIIFRQNTICSQYSISDTARKKSITIVFKNRKL